MKMFENGVCRLRESEGKTFSVVFAGDACAKTPEAVDQMLNHSRELAAGVKPFFDSADLRILQWECALTDTDFPIDKSGPNLKAPAGCAENFGKALGIDVMLLANNHIGDYGPDAVIDTIENVKKSGFVSAGAGKNLAEASQTVFVECKGIRIALINFAENEFGTASAGKPGVAPMDPFKNIAQIRAARKEADFVMVAIHGGHEFYSYPSPRMVELYREYAAAGADLVWNCHTHCPAGCENYNGVPVVYSPGNFYFPYRTDMIKGWNTGYLTKFYCDEKGVYAYELLPCKFDACTLSPLDEADRKLFFEHIEKLSAEIQDPERIQALFEAWCTKSGMLYLSSISNRPEEETWPPDWSVRERVAGWLHIRNVFTCESHTALLRQTLRLIEEYRVEEAAKLLPEVLELQTPAWMK